MNDNELLLVIQGIRSASDHELLLIIKVLQVKLGEEDGKEPSGPWAIQDDYI